MGTLLEMEPTPAQLMQQKGGARISALLATLTATDEVRAALAALPEVDEVDVRMAPAARPPDERKGPPTPPPAPLISPAQAKVRPQLTPPGMDADELRPESTVRVRAEALDQLLDQAAEVMHGIARLREAFRSPRRRGWKQTSTGCAAPPASCMGG